MALCQTKDLERHLGIYHNTIITLLNGLLIITARLISLILFMIIFMIILEKKTLILKFRKMKITQLSIRFKILSSLEDF